MKRIAASLAVVLVVVNGMYADIPSPDGRPNPPRQLPHRFPPPPLPARQIAEDKPLVIAANSPDQRVHLRLPSKLAKAIAAGPAVPAIEEEETDSRQRTAIAGIALSGAIVAAGFWLLRYRKRPVHLGKVAATTAATLMLFGCGLWRSWFHDEPLPPAQPIPGALCSGRVVIEPVDDGDKIEVRLPQDMAAKASGDTKVK